MSDEILIDQDVIVLQNGDKVVVDTSVIRASAQLGSDFIQSLFNEDVDFITKFLTVLMCVCITVEIVYLLSFRPIKQRLADLDCKGEGTSMTAIASITTFLMIIVLKIQRQSLAGIDDFDKLNERRSEKEMRHR